MRSEYAGTYSLSAFCSDPLNLFDQCNAQRLWRQFCRYCFHWDQLLSGQRGTISGGASLLFSGGRGATPVSSLLAVSWCSFAIFENCGPFWDRGPLRGCWFFRLSNCFVNIFVGNKTFLFCYIHVIMNNISNINIDIINNNDGRY